MRPGRGEGGCELGELNQSRICCICSADKIVVRPNLLVPDTQEIKKADIKSREVSKVSSMPPGLVNILTKEEMLDLLAFIESGGRKEAANFKK